MLEIIELDFGNSPSENKNSCNEPVTSHELERRPHDDRNTSTVSDTDHTARFKKGMEFVSYQLSHANGPKDPS